MFNRKARLGLQGRKSAGSARPAQPTTGRELVWMHCASLGEFEQGRPLLEAIRRESPQALVTLSFFSASGYEVVKNDPIADSAWYLPLDSPQHASDLLDQLRPTL